jgi:hypothetical protein
MVIPLHLHFHANAVIPIINGTIYPILAFCNEILGLGLTVKPFSFHENFFVPHELALPTLLGVQSLVMAYNDEFSLKVRSIELENINVYLAAMWLLTLGYWFFLTAIFQDRVHFHPVMAQASLGSLGIYLTAQTLSRIRKKRAQEKTPEN